MCFNLYFVLPWHLLVIFSTCLKSLFFPPLLHILAEGLVLMKEYECVFTSWESQMTSAAGISVIYEEFWKANYLSGSIDFYKTMKLKLWQNLMCRNILEHRKPKARSWAWYKSSNSNLLELVKNFLTKYFFFEKHQFFETEAVH